MFSGGKNIFHKMSHSTISLGRIRLCNKIKSNKYLFLCIFIFIACGGELTGEGVIRSPFHPNVYPGERTCRWIIHQPQGQVVLLNFTSFEIGSSNDCNTDYVEVRVKKP